MKESELRTELETAMKAKDALRVRVLRNVLAAIKNKSIDKKGGELAESELLAVVGREAKQCRETLDFARQAGREGTVAEQQAVLAVLESLLPGRMSEEELEGAIREILADSGADSIGPVMKALGERHAGRYDGKTASALVRKLLAG